MHTTKDLSNAEFDRNNVWHPYSRISAKDYNYYEVTDADGVFIQLNNNNWLIDGMSSWWCKVHGYNNSAINEAIHQQLKKFSHVMFGGLTHKPAIDLARTLVSLTPKNLTTVFFADSGSVAIEVAIKMAIQYWHAKGKPNKTKIVTVLGGYYGDTTGCMSVCDPEAGMHYKFSKILPKHIFVSRPKCQYHEECSDNDFAEMAKTLNENQDDIAAVLLEPIVQGAGGMYFYSPAYISRLRALCDKLNILLIHDEIATGFGRTGKLFACKHANISPDIMCVGKALTGGYMTLAATICTSEISSVISASGAFMHGPTFMANPLACATANCSLKLLIENNWQQQVSNIEKILTAGLQPCTKLKAVKQVRVLGAIGVVQMHNKVDISKLQHEFISRGVWLRPFNDLIYVMPPYIITKQELETLCDAIVKTIFAIYTRGR
jgi:adenosylmethionine-8-amino-7-oxononanoate aminotransferase